MMPDNTIHEALDALNDVRWRETAFADLQWYYAEGGVYIIRCKHGKPDAYLCAIRARSADEAVARANEIEGVARRKTVAQNATVFGNMAAMRDALKELQSRLVAGVYDGSIDCHAALEVVEKALAKPPRQCDVGTEQEQQDRFREFCRHYESEGECGIGRSEAACPAFQGGRNPDCSLWWAQMPYESEVEK